MNSETFATRQRSHLLILVLILALAAGLRFFSLSALGFWTDEFCTLSCSHGWGLQFDQVPKNRILPLMPRMTRLSAAQPMSAIIPAMARDEAHPPLYFLLLRLWEDVFGDSEIAVRSLDVVFSLAAIALLFFAAKESMGATAALSACLLMAVATPQIQFAQEARNYMPVVAFSLAAAWAILRFKRRPAIGLSVVLAAATLAMMMTHYFAAGVAGAMGIYALSSLRGRARVYALTAFVVAAVVFLAMCGPYLLQQLPQFQSNYAWVTDNTPGHAGRVVFNLCRLQLRLVGQWPQATILQRPAIVGGGLSIAGLPILYYKRPALRLWVLWIFGSIGMLVVVDLIRSTAQLALLRYALFASPAVYVLIAAATRGRLRFLPPALAICFAIITLPEAYVPPWKIDFRTPIQSIATRMGPNDGLVISGPDRIADGVMFAAFQHYIDDLPAASAVLTAPPDKTMLARLNKCPRVWIIWLWTDRSLSNFDVQEEGQVPFFAHLMLGRFKAN